MYDDYTINRDWKYLNPKICNHRKKVCYTFLSIVSSPNYRDLNSI